MVSGNPIALPGNAIALPGNPVALPSRVGTWQSNGTPGLIGMSFVYKALGVRTIHTIPCFVEKRFGAPIKIGTSGTSFVYNAFGACTARTFFWICIEASGAPTKIDTSATPTNSGWGSYPQTVRMARVIRSLYVCGSYYSYQLV